MIAAILLFLGSGGSLAVWIFAIRPYVVAHGKSYKTGASLGVAIWVDWQSCGEISKEIDDSKGQNMYWTFGIFQGLFVLGFVLLFT